MTETNEESTHENGIAENANVLITISTSEAEGMIRRWGIVSKAIGDLSVEALLRGAVDDRVLEALHSQRPQQYESEQEIAGRVKSILGSGYRVFVRDSDDPIDSARAPHVGARSILAKGNPEYQTGAFYVLHLTVEPFGAATLAAARDEADVASASEALRQGLTSSTTATPASTSVSDAGAEPVAAAADAGSAPSTPAVSQTGAGEPRGGDEIPRIDYSVGQAEKSNNDDWAGASPVSPPRGVSVTAPTAAGTAKIEPSAPSTVLWPSASSADAVTATIDQESEAAAALLATDSSDKPTGEDAEQAERVTAFIDDNGEPETANASTISAAPEAPATASSAVSSVAVESSVPGAQLPGRSAVADAVAAAAAAEGLHSRRAVSPPVAEVTSMTMPDEDTPALDEGETIEVYVAQSKKRLPKIEALMEQFRPKITELDFRGLFAGNFAGQASAAVDVTKLSALSPQTISAYLMKANALRQAGDYEKALSYYRVLLKSDPDNPDYRFLYGKALLEMGRIPQAREYLERARELGHENAAYELEKLESRGTKKSGLRFFKLLRPADSKR